MKSVVVTGGTKRLGAYIAKSLEEAGWRVLRTSHRPDPSADIIEDLTLPGSAASLMDKAVSLLGGRMPDALVNNAALFTLGDEDVSPLNYIAPVNLTELMSVRDNAGAVVNILDSRILYRPPSTPYEKSKADLRDFTLHAARKYAGRLRVNAVAPGPVLAPESVHEPAGHTPMGRPTPECVARAVEFLLGAQSTTGCIVPVDGGQSVLTFDM